jgi:hypothetical protein
MEAITYPTIKVSAAEKLRRPDANTLMQGVGAVITMSLKLLSLTLLVITSSVAKQLQSSSEISHILSDPYSTLP